jgi:hypothetical protein
MAKTTDDLEAVRTVTTALGGFSPEEQERIIRWAREKLGLAVAQGNLLDERTPQPSSPPASQRASESAVPTQLSAPATDLKTFVNGKSPKSDIQFAATVAYFYRFEAPPVQRRTEIDAGILQDACRLAGRKRLKHGRMTLNNAKNQGLLDSGSEAGKFAINTVGENLVAMTLPGQADSPAKTEKPKRPGKPAKKTPRKKK